MTPGSNHALKKKIGYTPQEHDDERAEGFDRSEDEMYQMDGKDYLASKNDYTESLHYRINQNLNQQP